MMNQTTNQQQDSRYVVRYKGMTFTGRTQKEALEKRDAYMSRKGAQHAQTNAEAAAGRPLQGQV